MKILVAEDEKFLGEVVCDSLKDQGYSVKIVGDGEEALSTLKNETFNLLLTDVKMPKIDGMTLLKEVRENYPLLSVIVMTTYASVSDAVTALKLGAKDYIVKPFEIEELLERVKRVEELWFLTIEKEELKKRLNSFLKDEAFFGTSDASFKLLQQVEKVAPLDVDVLLEGESGSGKEVIAKLLHSKSLRKDGPFYPVSCAALNQNLLESELFGHAKGAFTGAEKSVIGKIEMAHNGTLFLDDIDDMPLELQPKFLRVLEERIVEPLGSRERRKVNFRVISASKKDLKSMVAENKFREDLYYRLNVVKIRIPSLRERKEEIIPFFYFFLKKYASENNAIPDLSEECEIILKNHNWKGNLRELEHCARHCLIMAEGSKILPSHLPTSIFSNDFTSKDMESWEGEIDFDKYISMTEKKLILWALNKAQGNQVKAAELLKMARSTFQYKLSKIKE